MRTRRRKALDYLMKKPSLRRFFLIETVATFIALFLIVTVSLVSLRQATTLSSVIVHDSINDIHHTMALRLVLNRSAMPVNDYIIRAASEEKKLYQTLEELTDAQFKLVATILAPKPLLLQSLHKAEDEWYKAKQIAKTILAMPKPTGNAHAAVAMEKFDAQIDAATAILNDVYDNVYQNTLNKREELHQIESRATWLVIGVSIIGIVVALLGGVHLARLFFPPLERMLAGVRLFGRGRLEHRIDKEMPVELEELTNGINHMAGRLDHIYSALRESSHKDPLTGCYNRRKLDEDMIKMYSLTKRTAGSFSVLMFDLDYFKAVNDTYGHAAGDTVLVSITDIIRHQLRKHETLYRFGGEEFVVLLPATAAEGASVLAERIRASIAQKSLDVGTSNPIKVTVSIGITDNSQKEKSIKDLLESVDSALYSAKDNGRNRVVIAH